MANPQKKLTDLVTAIQVTLPKATTEKEEKDKQEQQQKKPNQDQNKKAGA